MVNIKNYIPLSETANSVIDSFTKSSEFLNNYINVYDNEKKSFLSHYIINNRPYLFQNNPILFEQLTLYIADKLGINPSEVKLIGSAKTGFSMSNIPEYGKPFSKNSDLDFSIINENIFYSLKDEFDTWADQYKKKSITPNNERQKFFWDDNLIKIPIQLRRGHIDSYKIPNWYEFPFAQKINNSLSLIVINLKDIYSIEVKGASARVYQSWNTFARQIKINTESVFKKMK